MIQAQIDDPVLLERLGRTHRDEMTVFILAGGRFRGAFLSGTRLVNQMRANHSLGLLETMTLGQAMLSAALLIPTMKGLEHLTLRYETDGPCAGFQAEADSTGYVRGFLLTNPIPVERPLDSWDLAPFLGGGTLTVSRLGEGMKAPQVGTVEIRERNIARDLAWYFEQSEQTRTAFSTSIQLDREGRVVGAGGMFLQSVPTAGGRDVELGEDEWLTERVERAFAAAPSLGRWISEGGNHDDVIHGLFREFDPISVLTRDVRFDCPCGAEHFARRIRALGRAELDDILQNDPDPLEVVCHNCGSVYRIPKEMLR